MSDLENEILAVIEALNDCVWQSRVDGPTIEQWLKEFGSAGLPGTRGRLHALYLLSRFMYFGDNEVRALLRALYRDCFKYPIVAAIRRGAGDTRDEGVLRAAYNDTLLQTRFLGMGNPSDSGTHLLYHYRQENDLRRRLFISAHEMFDLAGSIPTLADPSVLRYVFIDDFCGSGTQAVRYSRLLWGRMREAADQAGVDLRISYHVLVGTRSGLDRVRRETAFDVKCVLELDESFRALTSGSRYFRNPPDGISRDVARELAATIGEELSPGSSLGFEDSQLLLGFVHNTPNNTLPIFWHPGHATRTWHPVFRRYYKLA